MFLKQLNDILYKFLWNRKPDKIRRSTISLNYMQGGMKMVNVYNFERALKVTWIKKLITQQNSQWYRLLLVMHQNIDKILHFGDQWYFKILPKIKNKFWQNILQDWNILIKTQVAKDKSQMFRSCIWYNSDISKNTLFFPDWYKNGIYLVGDIMSANDNILSIAELKSKFNFNPNILNNYSIKLKVKSFISKQQSLSKWSYIKPTYPFHLDVLVKRL